MPEKTGKTALVTGASSGIGKAFAWKLATSGYDLVLVNRSQAKLDEIKEELQQRFGIRVTIFTADLSDEKDVDALMGSVSRMGDIHMLVNCAGYGSGVEFHQCKMADHLHMLNVHVVATLKLIDALLPQMIRRREGVIINVSSMGAFTPASGSTMYTGTKLFLKGFSESLHLEVGRYGIKVQCLCPGFTRTHFHENRRAGTVCEKGGMIPWMEPDQVAEISLKALKGSRVVVIPGFVNRLTVGIVRLLPSVVYYKLMSKVSAGQKKEESSTTAETNAGAPAVPALISGTSFSR